MKKVLLLMAMALFVCGTQAGAFEIDKWENHPIQIHGSFAQGWISTDENDWLTFDTEHGEGDFSFNDFVLNGSIVLTDSLNFGAQIISRDFGDVGNNELALDWAYFDYNFQEEIGLRLGRIKQPNGLYGDAWDLDIARTTVFLPPAYPNAFRDVVVSYDGASVYGTIEMGNFGSLNYTGIFGNQTIANENSLGAIYEALVNGIEAERSASSDYIWGGRVIWDTPVEGLRTAFSITQSKDMTTQARVFGVPTDITLTTLTQWFFSAEYTVGDWIFSSELRRLDFRFDGDAFGRQNVTSWGDYYIQAERQWTDAFSSALGFGQSTTNWSKKFYAGNDTVKTDAYISGRYDFTDYFILKADLHYIDGTAELYGQTDPEPNYWLFATKAILYF